MPFLLDSRHDILIFHHADPSRGSTKSRITEFFGLIFLRFASKEQLIITVSPFWESFLREKFSFTNIKTIYNPLSSELLQEVNNLNSTLRRYQYPKLKIYLGNASPKKGWPIALKVARKVFPEADYWVSGNIYNDPRGVKVNHFRGDDIEFIEFLKTIDISIFYSQFLEGWNRTLVEAALLSRSYTLNYSNSGGSIDVSTLIPSIISFRDDSELYNHLLRIKTSIRENKVYVDFDISYAFNSLAPSKFCSEWNLIIDRYHMGEQSR
jgi:glycosyltransferase involved in cell wall biosynthesis